MIKAIFFFIKIQFFAHRYEAIFSSSIIFNRGNQDSNKLFKPFKDFLEEQNIKYIVFEEPDFSGSFKRFSVSKKSISLAPVLITEIIIRKFLQNFLKNNEDKVERLIREIINKIFFRNLKTNKIFLLIEHKAELWRLAFPEAEIFDYQHGITYPGHPRYLQDGRPPIFREACKIITLTHSKLITNLLIQNDESGFYSYKNTISIGFDDGKIIKQTKNNNFLNILFSLQDASEGNHAHLNFYNKKVTEFLINNKEFFLRNNISITLKRHPRADLRLEENYKHISSNITITDKSDVEELLDDHNLHLTFSSTMAIDMAGIGIPTIFLRLEKPHTHLFPFLCPKMIFFSYLQYPLKDFCAQDEKSFQDIIIRNYDDLLSSDSSSSHKVTSWYKSIIEPFNSSSLKQIFNIPSK
tara:strand:- start:4014 stop:5243 length:1230 start_codon:yes stop_codon:yes gene_type:complete